MRWKQAGRRIADSYVFILDGFQGDQDYMAKVFRLNRGSLIYPYICLMFDSFEAVTDTPKCATYARP